MLADILAERCIALYFNRINPIVCVMRRRMVGGGMYIPFISRVRTKAYKVATRLRIWYLRSLWGMDIGDNTRISSKARLDPMHPRGVHIGAWTLISFDAAILTHDFVGERMLDTYIGSHCFIGARAIVMPGVRVGDHCVIGAGAIVTSDIPPHSIAVGVPAQVVRSDVETGSWGIIDPTYIAREKAWQAAGNSGAPPPVWG